MSIAAALVFVAGMASCKKDYECKCTDSDGNASANLTATYTKVKKKDAEDACDAIKSTWGAFGYSCTLEKK